MKRRKQAEGTEAFSPSTTRPFLSSCKIETIDRPEGKDGIEGVLDEHGPPLEHALASEVASEKDIAGAAEGVWDPIERSLEGVAFPVFP